MGAGTGHFMRGCRVTVRGPWQGVASIVRFNWPFYAVACVVGGAAGAGMWLAPRAEWQGAAALVGAGVVYFLVGSLGVSHLVYDRSDLYRWRWLTRVVPDRKAGCVVVCHAGFDEVSESLRDQLAAGNWRVLDHYDPVLMTEPSIRRARQALPPRPGTERVPFGAWPLESGSADLVFALLAIHELRKETERIAWFREARRCIRAGGAVVLVEHVRDLANGLAFGPGFLHFHSVSSWRRCWEGAGLRTRDEFRLTPWVRVFVLEAA